VEVTEKMVSLVTAGIRTADAALAQAYVPSHVEMLVKQMHGGNLPHAQEPARTLALTNVILHV